ncbi:allophanate hydrolase [Arthrobacter woluwensis]|uniref:5-oxoprolinase subunit C family protein n=1 Tax=Arthrobacter woluwensis TaxID=156980 RepID=UPI000D11FAB1|nr:biotin-dependent carboxyltransferase family protein [Arthrobacter woluwensis]PSS43092.1 allophanate hydrolase [Arthrobacter woluwensis]
MALEIISPGLSTTVQDRGRNGHYNVGIPQSGFLDRYSAELANALVGNQTPEGPGLAALECSYMGPSFKATKDTVIAVTGAPVEIKVNGLPAQQWSRIQLAPGDFVTFGAVKSGIRFYIGVRGGIDVPLALGSRSTYALGGIGGLDGRKLQAGDVLPTGRETAKLPSEDTVPEEHRPIFGGEQTVRVLMGLYEHRLTDSGRETFLNERWILTPVADRMGLRYSGPGVEWKSRVQPFGAGADPSNIVDAGYAVGSIQIPGGTQPIILHRDAVSGGGYATVGTVISADMDLVARASPGTITHFTEVTMAEALQARKRNREQLEKALAALN